MATVKFKWNNTGETLSAMPGIALAIIAFSQDLQLIDFIVVYAGV